MSTLVQLKVQVNLVGTHDEEEIRQLVETAVNNGLDVTLYEVVDEIITTDVSIIDQE